MDESNYMRRRQFLIATGITLAEAGMATRAASARMPEHSVANRRGVRPGVAPGYIVSGRGQHHSNPFFRAQGGPVNQRGPRPKMVHGRGIEEDSQ